MSEEESPAPDESFSVRPESSHEVKTKKKKVNLEKKISEPEIFKVEKKKPVKTPSLNPSPSESSWSVLYVDVVSLETNKSPTRHLLQLGKKTLIIIRIIF